MIVTCEQCSTQFQLDDARVPDDGVRVRCSRCKHAFVVKKPAAAGDPVDRAVEQAVDDGAATQEDGKPFDDSLEESDWEFNHDSDDEPAPELGEDEAATAQAPPSESDGSMEGLLDSHALDEEDLSEPSGLEIGGALGGDVEEEIDTALGGDVEEEIDPAIGGASAGMPASALAAASEPPAAAAPQPAPEPPPAAPEQEAAPSVPPPSDDPFAPAPSDDPFAAPAADAPAASAELGSPENWDFFDEKEASPAATSAPVAIGRIALTSPRPAARPPVDVDAEPSKVVVWLGRMLGVAGWLTVCGLLGVAIHGLVSPRPDVSTPASPGSVGGLGVSDVRARWLDNAVAGPIYVISGTLHNTGARQLTTGSRLAIQLLDAGGTVIADDVTSVGLPVPERRLRTAPPAEMQAQMLLEAHALARTPFRPGTSRRFQALLQDLPREAERFDLVALPVDAAASGAASTQGAAAPQAPPGPTPGAS
ncbi:MAG: zinc-ribbon domain-containing protein [Myxococcota bacterium]|nr:zinc-ribbon domain-containing protein [Myxococcota bacterium]